jgi:hypothetical protein
MRETLLLLPDSDERRALVRAVPSDLAFRFCRSVRVLHTCLGPNTEAIICGPNSGLAEHPKVLEMIDAYGIKLIILCFLTHSSVAGLAALCQRFQTFRVSLRRAAEGGILTKELTSMMNEPDGGPIGVMTSRLTTLVSTDGLLFVVAALVLGRDRTDVPSYAAICGLAPRSLQASLQRLALPAPYRLLAWGRACWMVWRMDRYGWNSKQAATAGGFANASAMAAALTPVTGKSPRALARGDGITLLTNLFEAGIVL